MADSDSAVEGNTVSLLKPAHMHTEVSMQRTEHHEHNLLYNSYGLHWPTFTYQGEANEDTLSVCSETVAEVNALHGLFIMAHT